MIKEITEKKRGEITKKNKKIVSEVERGPPKQKCEVLVREILQNIFV